MSAARILRALVTLAVIGLSATVLAAFVPSWPFELVEHFRVQLALLGILLTVGAVSLRLGMVDAAAIATLIHGISLLPVGPVAQMPAPGTRVRVLVLNVLKTSSSFSEVRRLIDDTDPDVIGLVEVDQLWLDALAPSLARYPGRVEAPLDNYSGTALYARGRVTGGVESPGPDRPSIVAQVAVGPAAFSVIVAHPLPPVTSAWAALHDAELGRLAERARDLSPVLLIGDFNVTPWSRSFRRLLAVSGLCDSRDGFGLQATYPTSPAWLRIPIDHVLHPCSFGVTDRRIERDVGSDHLPVVVDLVIPHSDRVRP